MLYIASGVLDSPGRGSNVCSRRNGYGREELNGVKKQKWEGLETGVSSRKYVWMGLDVVIT